MSSENTGRRISARYGIALLFVMSLAGMGCLSRTQQDRHFPADQVAAAQTVDTFSSPRSGAIRDASGSQVSRGVQATGITQSGVNVGVAEISDLAGYRQVVALSDAHGMFDNLTHLLSACKLITPDRHWLADRTLLIVTGDSIDKGPKSLEVLDLWRTLSAEAPATGSRLVVLLGNHEAEFLADPTTKKAAALRDELQARGSDVHSLLDPTGPQGRFLRSLPVAARVGKRWLFCHAGWVPKMPYADFVAKAQSVLRAGDYSNDFLIGGDSILEKKSGRDGDKWWESPVDVQDLKDRLTADGLYGVVFGHQPTAFGLEGAIGPYNTKDARFIKIDSGMAPEAGAHPGHLLQFTVPDELTHNQRPAHIFSVGFDDGHPGLQTTPL